MRQIQEAEQPKERRKRIRFWNPGNFYDFTLLFLIIFLVGFGLVMVYSASSYTAALDYGSSAYYLKRQAVFAVIGLALMFFISMVDYHILKKFTVIGFLVISALLLVTLIAGSAGGAGEGSTRWIELGPIRFQPSELAKLVIIMYVAYAATQQVWKLNDWKILAKIMVPPLIIIGLIVKENLSTAIICGVITVAILFVASPKYWHFFVIGIAAVLGGVAMVLLESYRGDRFDAWMNVETHPKGYQTLQSLYAIGSGGLWGKGLGQSIQKMDFIPEGRMI